MFTKEYVEQALREEHLWKAGESDTFEAMLSQKWEFTLRKEEEKYAPYKYSLKGNKIGTSETWSRRYLSMGDAFLHIVNHLNENANVKNRYDSIEAYIMSDATMENSENLKQTQCLDETDERKPKVNDWVYLIMITGYEKRKFKYGLFKAKVISSKRGLNEYDHKFEAIVETGRKQLVEFSMDDIGKAVFFKESDAKKALKKLEGGEQA